MLSACEMSSYPKCWISVLQPAHSKSNTSRVLWSVLWVFSICSSTKAPLRCSWSKLSSWNNPEKSEHGFTFKNDSVASAGVRFWFYPRNKPCVESNLSRILMLSAWSQCWSLDLNQTHWRSQLPCSNYQRRRIDAIMTTLNPCISFSNLYLVLQLSEGFLISIFPSLTPVEQPCAITFTKHPKSFQENGIFSSMCLGSCEIAASVSLHVWKNCVAAR